MKNIKKIIKTGFLALILSLTAENTFAQAISTQFFGQNAWMPHMIGSTVLNGKLDKHWGNIRNSGTAFVRYGGITCDRDMPTNQQYIAIIDSIRKNGMEPIIQVPFDKYKYTAQQAAGIVTYINKTQGRNVKYWSIGNEPDLGYSYTNAGQVAAYYKAFSSAMKNVDPSIKIIGPDCAWFNKAIMDGLTSPNGADDITGKDAAGRYYLDVISFHTYPFNGSQTRDQVISKLTASGSFQDNLVYLNTRVAACNAAHGRTGAAALTTAVTEANVDYKNPDGDNIQGLGVNSFIGGQFVAEMLGIAMKNNVGFVNLWSVVEGNGLATNIGYIDPSTGNKKPVYHHFKMMADNFKGDVAACTSNQASVKAFGSKNSQRVSVLVMNQNATGTSNYTVRLNNEAIAGASAVKINVNAGIAAEHTGTLSNQASVMLTFNAQGILIKTEEYSLATHALANLPPTVTNLNNTTGVGEEANTGRGIFEMKNIYPNPAPGKFVIALNKGGNVGVEEKVQVEIINLLGQVVYDKELTFLTGKEEVHLSPAIANGEYILRVKEGTQDNYLVKKLMVQK